MAGRNTPYENALTKTRIQERNLTLVRAIRFSRGATLLRSIKTEPHNEFSRTVPPEDFTHPANGIFLPRLGRRWRRRCLYIKHIISPTSPASTADKARLLREIFLWYSTSMLTFEQMMLRFIVALILGAILGIERELVGKGEAGVRTEMLVAGGAAIFAMVGLTLPYIVSAGTGNLADVIARNSGFLTVIANIVVGIGFLGAGIIVKADGRPRGITTAALVWATAAIGIMVGIGLTGFAATAAVLLALLLYILRKTDITKQVAADQETT